MRRRRFHRSLGTEDAFDFGFAVINLSAAGDIEFIEVRAAENHMGKRSESRFGNDGIDPPGLVANLHPHFRGDVQMARRGHGHTRRTALRAAVHQVEIKILLLICERAVRLNLAGINELAPCVGDEQQTLIRNKLETGRLGNPSINDAPHALAVNQPDFFGNGIGNINVAAVRNCESAAIPFARLGFAE